MINPFLYMLVAVFCALGAIGTLIAAIAGTGSSGWMLFIIFLLLLAGALFKYKMGRTMMAYVITDGGTIGSIFVKRSMIEDKTLSEEEIDRIIAILTKLVREKHS